MMMMSSHFHWLLVILLLTDSTVGHTLSGPHPPSLRLAAAPAPGHSSQDARSVLSALAISVDGHVRLRGNVSCSSLRRLPRGDSPLTQELLGLAELPLLLSAGCQEEALALTHGLYRVLGRKDTHALIRQLTQLLKNSPALPTVNNFNAPLNDSVSPDNNSASPRDNSEPSLDTYSFNQNGSSAAHENTDLHDNTDAQHLGSNSQSNTGDDRVQAECHLNALVFNIQQLAKVGTAEGFSAAADGDLDSCAGWLRMQGAQLVGQKVGKRGPLHKAQHLCQRLGPKCIGVAQSGDPADGQYQALLRAGSRVLPAHADPGAECWLRQCVPGVGLGLARVRRSAMVAQQRCVSQQEQQVYAVVEWVPAVSTLYNLGTAVYYAARNCTDTARERAILSAVDLGTDALMAITGGTVGVAGYALGAGVKTGVKASVKYLMNKMGQGQGQVQGQDVLVNQESWEDGTFTIQ
ncbi:uncharacterized protein apof [Alosa sapidissima]|uniref:uncharacterized protein apof n=1 Tax=Alosa sapidissima TaxID=34773 RepID=UPI001C089049|nr:uncharacterized protein apof [Alosa sapidissima]XP_041946435.1 uncharacterized protein apof [Alosa sapidissima]XP_041946436.1 uncharacterized protein apof [Alosa sapidissima]